MPGRRLYVDMGALLEAMDTRAEQPAFVFDTLTGEIAVALEPSLAPPGAPPPDAEGIVPIPRARGESGPHAVSASPQTLEDHDQRQAHQRQLLDQALAWLDTLGIDPQFELVTARRPRPLGRPGRSLGQPAIGLFDLLLLGGLGPSPDADPDAGFVSRRFLAASQEQAHAVFVRVARELCEHHGQPWRRDVVEAQAHYEVGRTRLVLQGKTVELEIEVAAALRALFRPDRGPGVS